MQPYVHQTRTATRNTGCNEPGSRAEHTYWLLGQWSRKEYCRRSRVAVVSNWTMGQSTSEVSKNTRIIFCSPPFLGFSRRSIPEWLSIWANCYRFLLKLFVNSSEVSWQYCLRRFHCSLDRPIASKQLLLGKSSYTDPSTFLRRGHLRF